MRVPAACTVPDRVGGQPQGALGAGAAGVGSQAGVGSEGGPRWTWGCAEGGCVKSGAPGAVPALGAHMLSEGASAQLSGASGASAEGALVAVLGPSVAWRCLLRLGRGPQASSLPTSLPFCTLHSRGAPHGAALVGVVQTRAVGIAAVAVACAASGAV